MSNQIRPRPSLGNPTQVRPRLQRAGAGPVATPYVPETTLPSVGQATSRDVTLGVTDTQEGFIAPICYGRVRFAPKITHFDIVNLQIEMQVLVGEGEIDGFEAVYIDDVECYAATVGWADVQVRTGTLAQTAVTNITNATIAAMTHPGMAYVSARVSLLTAPLNGGIPHVEVVVRGRKVYSPQSTATAWNENPVDAALDALLSADYGAGVASGEVDLTGAAISEGSCNHQVDYGALAEVSQTLSDADAGFGDYDRLQSFVMPVARGVHITVAVTVQNNAPLAFPCRLRTSPSGTDILPDLAYAIYLGNGTHGVSAWFLNTEFTPGATYYLVFPASADLAWRLNTTTNAYAGGGAQAKIAGTWTAVNYDHYFVVSRAECQYRCSLVISQRQPVEDAAKLILQTCNGRLGWWDGKYRITLDGSATGSLVISDLQSPVPDVPLLQDSLSCGRSDAEIPNTAKGEYLDTETWTRLPVKVETPAMQAGSEQPRVLDVGFVAVPSGGQLYRLLTTWLARCARTWRASAKTMQHGMRLAPGDTATLTSKLWTGSKTVLADAISDGADGTFDVALVEYDAADFSAAPYVPQAAIATVTTLTSNFVLYADDFTRGGTTAGTVGELLWPTVTATIAYLQISGHPGVASVVNGNLILNGSSQLFADNAVWATRWILSPHAIAVGGVVYTSEVFQIEIRNPAGTYQLWVDLVNTGLTCAPDDWLIIDDSCARAGTGCGRVQKNGVSWYSGSKAVSSTTVDNFLRATAAASCTLYVDYARLQLGATR